MFSFYKYDKSRCTLICKVSRSDMRRMRIACNFRFSVGFMAAGHLRVCKITNSDGILQALRVTQCYGALIFMWKGPTVLIPLTSKPKTQPQQQKCSSWHHFASFLVMKISTPSQFRLSFTKHLGARLLEEHICVSHLLPSSHYKCSCQSRFH